MDDRRRARYYLLKHLLDGSDVLEVGIADGNSALLLAELAKSVVSVDHDAARVTRARVRHVRDNLQFRVADPIWLAPSEMRFDGVLVPDSEGWLWEDGFLEEVRRVLRPDGWFFAVDRRVDRVQGLLRRAELRKRLGAYFPRVRLLVERPFVGVAVVEDGELLSPALDQGYAGADSPISHQWVLAGAGDLSALEPVVMQLPTLEPYVQVDERESMRLRAELVVAVRERTAGEEGAAARDRQTEELLQRVAAAERRAEQAEEEAGRIMARAAEEQRGLRAQLAEIQATPSVNGVGPGQAETVRRLAAAVFRLRRERGQAETRASRARTEETLAKRAHAHLQADRLGDLWRIDELRGRMSMLERKS